MRFAVSILVILVLAALGACHLSAETVAEYTGTSTAYVGLSSGAMQARSFEVSMSHTVTEVRVKLKRLSGSTGTVAIQLRLDNNGKPSIAIPHSHHIFVDKVSVDQGEWMSMTWSPGTTISPGKWWIVCEVSAGSDAQLGWQCVSGNPYPPAQDCKMSMDGGNSWTAFTIVDTFFGIFGTRVTRDTDTTVTASATTVSPASECNIEIEVRDHTSGALVQGPGKVDMSATDGTLGDGILTLTNGKASTTWTAPLVGGGSYTITADYRGHSEGTGGIDYNSSTNYVTIGTSNDNRTTTTSQTLGATTVNTRQQIVITADVVDQFAATVPGGTVAFQCSTGGFSAAQASVNASGRASTTWTAGNTSGTFAIEANYLGGFTSGATTYGPSSDSDDVTISYTPVSTNTYVTVSPDHPFVGATAFVTVKVTDSVGDLVPGGTVQFSATSGFCSPSSTTFTGGKCMATYYAPDYLSGYFDITATYQGNYAAGGNLYGSSSNGDTVHVLYDPDDGTPTPGGLSWMTEWITDYDEKPLPNAGLNCTNVSDKLTALGWGGKEHANQNAWETDMKGDWTLHDGHENDRMDIHDFIMYSGHGNPDFITFITWEDFKKLYHFDVYDMDGDGNWGDKDAEWVAFQSCQVLSHDSYWASTMDGLHMLLGFHTNSEDAEYFGKYFAELLIKDGMYDEPHRLYQAWFLAADRCMETDKKQRVVAEDTVTLNDWLWGQGMVADDVAHDDTYSYVDNDITTHSNPHAEIVGDPYTVESGALLQLDASASYDPDEGDYLRYIWDLDTDTDTDDGDWDNNGIDSAFDDADVWGRRPQVVFMNPGPGTVTYNIGVMVVDSQEQVGNDFTTVDVLPEGGGGGAAAVAGSGQSNGGIEVVDNFPSLPPETMMPVFRTTGGPIGFNEMASVASYFGMEGEVGQDDLGDWHIMNGANELCVNEYTGAVMYMNRNEAYIYKGPPGSLPSEGEAVTIAEGFINSNGIARPGTVLKGVTNVCYGEGQKSSRTAPTRIPYQRRVNYSRNLNAMGTDYPVVGPGGKISVLVDQSGDARYFVKIWRDTYEAEPIDLYQVEQAINDFHRLVAKALIPGSTIPECNRVEIDDVSVGYYEKDFSTPQTAIYPVYILEVTCEDDRGSQVRKVYLSAVAAPVEPSITSPLDGTEVQYGQAISFSGSAIGGTSPYTYEWYSDIDGLLGTGANINATLSGNQKEAQAQMHTITLRATDQNGMTGDTTIHVKILPDTLDFARQQPDGSEVWLLGPITTGILSDRYYIEKPDRSAGIAVNITPFPQEGDAMSVRGDLATVGGERMIVNGTAAVGSTGNPVPDPLFMRNSFLGGADLGAFTPGVFGGVDVYNVGLLATAAGRVTAVYSGYFYVDDGCALQDGTGNIGVRVLCDTYQPLAGSYVVVTGISGAMDPGGWIIPALRTRKAADVIEYVGY